jgi:voltage-gated potassium channel
MPEHRAARPTPPHVAAEQRRLRIALGSFVGVLFVGWIGHMALAGLGPLDALYQTVITVTTVGSREVADPSPVVKVFTVALISAGVVAVSYSAVTGMEFFIDGHLHQYLENRRMDRIIDALDDHVIICGYGRVGRQLAQQLAVADAEFVVIDDDEGKVDEAADAGHATVRGDASVESVLQAAGIDRAAALVAAVNSDADNVLITLTAKGMRPDLTVIGRVKLDETEPKLRRAGADRVISPSTIGGRRIAQILTRPVVADFLDRLGGGAVDYTLEEIPVRRGGDLDGVTLRDARIRERFGVTVLAVRHVRDDQLDSHPSPTAPLHDGDILGVMGSEDEVKAMRAHFTGRGG